jgi:DNA repair protein RadC
MRHRSGTLPPAGGPERDAQLASDLLRSRREEITLALDLDDRDRLLGTAILTEGGVQAARLSARPILRGSQACQASRCILDRYRRCGPREAEQSSFRVIAAACSRYGFTLVDHIVVVASGD